MKYGIIDIGTNSMRLLLAEYCDGKFIKREKIINTTRIGEGLDISGKISNEAIKRNINSLDEFKGLALKYGCDEIHCIGTAALRNASNGREFVNLAKKYSGIDVEIISGKYEALLGYRGVVSGLSMNEKYYLILDIGGGSTEFIIGNDTDIIFRESVDIGALKLTEKFIKYVPETDEMITELNYYIHHKIKNVVLKILSLGKSMDLIGIGGTITSVSAIKQKLENYSMEKIHLSNVNYLDIKSQIEEIRLMTMEERYIIKGLQKKRANIIISGELILMNIMDMLGKDKIIVSEFDNLEGYILYNYSNKI